MKFSIITVCRNDIGGLKATQASVARQSLANYEWLVIDGASNDGTLEYLQSITDPRLHFLSENDGGLYDAMNKGIRMARGDFMVFLNSGDMFASENTLANVQKAIEVAQKPALVYGDAIDFEPNGETHYRKARNHHSIARGMFTQHQSIFFARFENEKQPYYQLEYKLSADYQFIIQYLGISKSGWSVIRMKEPLCRFELGGLNESQRYKAIREDFRIRRIYLKINPLVNLFLFGAHFAHTFFKRLTPRLMKDLRYSSR